MKIIAKLVVLASVIMLAWATDVAAQAASPRKGAPPATAQAAPVPSATPQGESNTPPPPGWVARCASTSRAAPLECAVEETAILSKTG